MEILGSVGMVVAKGRASRADGDDGILGEGGRAHLYARPFSLTVVCVR